MGKKRIVNAVIVVLRKQQLEHGDIASIEDLIDLIKKSIY